MTEQRESPKVCVPERNAPWTACDLSPPSLKRLVAQSPSRKHGPVVTALCVTSPASHGGNKFPQSTASPEFSGVFSTTNVAATFGVFLLCATQSFAQAPAQPTEPDPLAELRDNARLVEVPWPEWVWWAIGLGSLLLLAIVAWVIVRIIKNRPKTPPPTPREIAIHQLNTLRGKMLAAESYPFSVEVSDVLRTFISGHYSLFATQQTSPEFLASISSSPRFSSEDRDLLAKFLERCDMIKFARIETDTNENVNLLGEAVAFVEGGKK